MRRDSGVPRILAMVGRNWSSGNDDNFGGRFVCVHGLTQDEADEFIAAGKSALAEIKIHPAPPAPTSILKGGFPPPPSWATGK
jgi:hypothetical protein